MPDDPLRDMERRLDSLASKIDLTDQQVRNDLYGLRQDISDIRRTLAALATDYVRRVEFIPVKQLAFGLVALIMSGFFTAVIGLVVTR